MVSLPRRRLLKQWTLILLATVLGVNLLLLLVATFAGLMERLEKVAVMIGGDLELDDSRMAASVRVTDERLLAALEESRTAAAAAAAQRKSAEVEVEEEKPATIANDSVNAQQMLWWSSVVQPPAIDIVRPCLGLSRRPGRYFAGGGNHHHHHHRRLLVVVFLIFSGGGGGGDNMKVGSDVLRRRLIRETFGGALKRSRQAELYFVYGRPAGVGVGVGEGKLEEEQLRAESRLHNDILVFNSFAPEDPHKSALLITLLRWTALRCSGGRKAQFALFLPVDFAEEGNSHTYFIRVKPFLASVAALSSSSSSSSSSPDQLATTTTSSEHLRTVYYHHGRSGKGNFYLAPVARLAALYEALVATRLQSSKAAPPTTFGLPPFADHQLLEQATNLTAARAAVLPGAENFFLKTAGDCPNATTNNTKVPDDQTLRCLWATFGEE